MHSLNAAGALAAYISLALFLYGGSTSYLSLYELTDSNFGEHSTYRAGLWRKGHDAEFNSESHTVRPTPCAPHAARGEIGLQPGRGTLYLRDNLFGRQTMITFMYNSYACIHSSAGTPTSIPRCAPLSRQPEPA